MRRVVVAGAQRRCARHAAAASTSSTSVAVAKTAMTGGCRRLLLHTEKRMAEQGIALPAYQDAVWNYVKAQRDGDKFYLTTHVGQRRVRVASADGKQEEEEEKWEVVRAKVVRDDHIIDGGQEGESVVSARQATALARQAGLRLLSTLSHHLDGDLDRVEQVLKVHGIVNGEPGFTEHGRVIDGCSQLLVEVLGDRGRHARTCTGAGSLPAAVTCDMVVKVRGGD